MPRTLDGSRLFARIHALDFECPKCGDIVSIPNSRAKVPGWNSRAGLYRCPRCHLAMQLGVLIYPVSAGGMIPHNPIPQDWTPTPRQGTALRQLQTAIHLSEANRQSRRPDTPRNLRGAACTCLVEQTADAADPQYASYRVVRHPGCPIHVGGAAGRLESRDPTSDNPPDLSPSLESIEEEEEG